MSIITHKNKCSGCGKCVEICPGNLLALEEESKGPFIRRPEDCWDCMACVKICPHGALETKLPYQLANYKASLQPLVYPDRIVWQLTDLLGNKEDFVIKTLEI